MFHKQPRSKIQCACQHHKARTTNSPGWLLNLPSKLPNALPEPDFNQKKNLTPSLTPNLAISYSTQQERKVNKSLPPFLAQECLEAWMWLITKQKYYNNLLPWVKLSHSLDLWPSRGNQRRLLVSLDSVGDSSTQLTLNEINSKR